MKAGKKPAHKIKSHNTEARKHVPKNVKKIEHTVIRKNFVKKAIKKAGNAKPNIKKSRSSIKTKPLVKTAKVSARTHAKQIAEAALNRKERTAEKAKKQHEIDEATYTENALAYIKTLAEDAEISDYLNKNVSRHAGEVLSLLNTPRTDEEIAASLDLKINAVRRILNIMQGYGITNYTVSKNNEGWLSFAWYINTNKVPQFLDYVKNTTSENTILKEECNDYFVCNSCYDENKFIFTFDAAYESGFKCNICNKQLTRIDKEKVGSLLAAPKQARAALPHAEEQQTNIF